MVGRLDAKGSEKSVLTQYAEGTLVTPSPAKLPTQVIAGPNHSERQDDQQCWQRNSHTFKTAVGTFLGSGCICIKDVIPKEFVKYTLGKVTNDYNFLQSQLSERRKELLQNQQTSSSAHHLAASIQRVNFRELVQRDGNRLDMRYQLSSSPYASPHLVYNPIVFPLVKELLGGGDVSLLYCGVMWANPTTVSNNNGNQKWHSDGPPLFNHQHTFPYCINVFYPLVDLTEEMGPTQFYPGSHVLGNFSNDKLENFSICCDAGAAVIFDYRIKHRGSVNTSKSTKRPVLYLAYAQTWYVDRRNERSGKSVVGSNYESPTWVSRILSGAAMPTMKWPPISSNTLSNPEGTDDNDSGTNHVNKKRKISPSGSQAPSTNTGERWILFELNVDLDDAGNFATIRVHNGDIPIEVASQFVIKHKLPNDFVGPLTELIQNQMVSARST